MSVFSLPIGSKVHRCVRGASRRDDTYEVISMDGEIVELRNEESRFVRMTGDYLCKLDGSWMETKAQAMAEMALRLEQAGRRMLEQAQELRDQAGAE